ncbi:MAG: DUF4423 domain-containing protein [Bdellovibrionaceae bacterium]|nr:DUF4423 domain-containing protein [Pseudobdellovibrionaceae bacterium]
MEIAAKLHLDDNEKNLLALLTRADRHTISDENFSMIKEWHHFAILSVLELNDFETSIPAIARALNLSESTVQDSVEKMTSQNLLLRDADGTLSPTGLSYFTTDDIPSLVIQAAHRDGLSLSAQALEEVPTLERDFTALTFSGSSRQLARAKKEIRRCLDRVSQIMASPDKDQVYRMSIQLFPVLKTKDPA